MLYGHGDDGYRFGTEIIADFSTNVWYGGEPAGLKEHILKNWSAINRYPEVLGESLAEQIAAHHRITFHNILVNSGSTESIYLIAQAFEKKRISIVTPTFSEYEDAARLYGHEVNYINWSELTPTTTIKADLLFICNPNNPTGEVFFEIEELLKNNLQTIFVIDEAFIEFTLSVKSGIPLIDKFENLIILRSLTKAYAIPGLRLGYIVAPAAIIDKIKQLKFPWAVNTIALEAGKFIFNNFETVQIPLESLLKDKAYFTDLLTEGSIKVHNSYTHFFLAEISNGSAVSLKKYLMNNHGILIRDASNFYGLANNHIRLATLSAAKNQLLVNALKEWNKSIS